MRISPVHGCIPGPNGCPICNPAPIARCPCDCHDDCKYFHKWLYSEDNNKDNVVKGIESQLEKRIEEIKQLKWLLENKDEEICRLKDEIEELEGGINNRQGKIIYLEEKLKEIKLQDEAQFSLYRELLSNKFQDLIKEKKNG